VGWGKLEVAEGVVEDIHFAWVVMDTRSEWVVDTRFVWVVMDTRFVWEVVESRERVDILWQWVMWAELAVGVVEG
jgi:hypothetical protein